MDKHMHTEFPFRIVDKHTGEVVARLRDESLAGFTFELVNSGKVYNEYDRWKGPFVLEAMPDFLEPGGGEWVNWG